jgi:hypothetical protein
MSVQHVTHLPLYIQRRLEEFIGLNVIQECWLEMPFLEVAAMLLPSSGMRIAKGKPFPKCS